MIWNIRTNLGLQKSVILTSIYHTGISQMCFYPHTHLFWWNPQATSHKAAVKDTSCPQDKYRGWVPLLGTQTSFPFITTHKAPCRYWSVLKIYGFGRCLNPYSPCPDTGAQGTHTATGIPQRTLKTDQIRKQVCMMGVTPHPTEQPHHSFQKRGARTKTLFL